MRMNLPTYFIVLAGAFIANVDLARAQSASCGTPCFPSLAFTPPEVPSGQAPNVTLSSWWCPRTSEYGFMGFSYDVGGCPTYDQMLSHFSHQRRSFGARYARLYGACDSTGHTDSTIRAAYAAGVGVFPMVWFGFDGDDQYKPRLAAWLNTFNNNKLAPYVVRHFAIGSEPLYDSAISHTALANLIDTTKANISSKGIEVTTSEMAYGYQLRNATALLSHEDHIQAHILPFFSQTATVGGAAWSDVKKDLDWFVNQTSGQKKIFLSQTGWPSTDEVWPGNSPTADASLASELAYYQLLESQCAYFKSLPQGGLGWFAHLYADDTLPGWGVVKSTTVRTPKISFGASSQC